uniref:Uncharacterized protein n=1 Tax=Echinococcus canadensis TaxID=519352 RepID=A0A915EZJ6_9CEST
MESKLHNKSRRRSFWRCILISSIAIIGNHLSPL